MSFTRSSISFTYLIASLSDLETFTWLKMDATLELV